MRSSRLLQKYKYISKHNYTDGTIQSQERIVQSPTIQCITHDLDIEISVS